jgi:hypothetical protein
VTEKFFPSLIMTNFVSFLYIGIVTCEWLDIGFGLLTGFIEHLYFVTTGTYNSFMDLHNLQITTPNIMASVSSPVVSGQWFSTVGFLCFCDYIVSGWLLSHNSLNS